LSKDNIYDLEDEKVKLRDLKKMDERDLKKVLRGDSRAARKLYENLENPKKDHLLAASGKGGDKVDDQEYVGKEVEVKWNGRYKKAIVKYIKGDDWEVEIDEGRRYPTVETFSRRELKLPDIEMRPGHRLEKIAKGKDKVGMKVKVGRRGEKGEIERDNKDGTYDVYMVEDRRVKKGVDERDIEFPDAESASDGELRVEVYDKKYNEKRIGVVVKKEKREWQIQFDDDGKKAWFDEQDCKVIPGSKGGKGGELYDIEIDVREAEKLNVSGSYTLRISCGRSAKDIKGRKASEKFDERDRFITFKQVNPDEARTIKIELEKAGRLYGSTTIGKGEIELRDVVDSDGKEKSLKLKDEKDRGRSAGTIWYKVKAKYLGAAGGGRTSAKVGGGMVKGEKWNGVRPKAIYQIENCTVAVCDGDLLDYEGDAIVNVCDRENRGESGLRLDEDLNKEGGRDFVDNRKDLRSIKIGSAKACKPAGKIRCQKWVIHAALQKFGRDVDRDLEDLEYSYKAVFKEAEANKVKSMAMGLMPPSKWMGRDAKASKVIRTGLKQVKKVLEDRDNRVTEVCFVASGRDLDDIEDEMADYLRDFAKKGKSLSTLQTMADIFDYADDNRNGTLDRKEFELLMDKLGLNKKEAGILFDYYDRDGDGTMSLDEFRHIEAEALENHKRNPGNQAPPSKDAPLKRWAEELIEKLHRILKEYKSFKGEDVQAKDSREDDREWMDATIIRVNEDDGTFQVEFLPRRGRSYVWKDCPRHNIRLPVVTKSKVKLEISKTRDFPGGSRGFLRRSANKHYINVETRDVESLGKTELVSGSQPDFRQTISFTCKKREYKELKLVVKGDNDRAVAKGVLYMDDDRYDGRGFTKNIRCEPVGGGRDKPEFDVTVTVETSISVADAFKEMDDRKGEIELKQLIKFAEKNGIRVKERDLEDLFDAIDQDKQGFIKRKTFCGFAGVSDMMDFAEALKQASNKMRGGGSGGGGKCKVKLTVVELEGMKDRECTVTVQMGREKFTTKPSQRRGRVDWDESFSVSCESGDFDRIEFDVDEDDRGRPGRSIGKGELTMRGSRGKDLWKDLAGDKRGKKGSLEIKRDVFLHYKLAIESESEPGGGRDGDDPSRWTDRDVEDWLVKKKFDKYIRDFERVDGKELLRMDKRELESKCRKASSRDIDDMLDAIDRLKESAKDSGRGRSKSLEDMTEDDVIDALGDLGRKYKREIRDAKMDGRALKKMRDERDVERDIRDRRDAREIWDMVEKLKKGGDDRGRDRSRDRGRDSSRDRKRDSSKGKDESKNSRDRRSSSRDRGRDSSRDRKRDSSRDRRSSSRDRGRDSSRDRKRDSSRDRDSGRRSTRNRDSSRDRGGRSSTRNRDRSAPADEPKGELEVTFQFGVSNPNSTRVMACKENETALEVCEKIHTKYLASVQANEMELVFNDVAMAPDKKLFNYGVRDKDRIIIRRKKS